MKKRWTLKELNQLRGEIESGFDLETIAERHGRTVRSVYNKTHRLRREGKLYESPVECIPAASQPTHTDNGVVYFTIALTALNLTILIANVLLK